MSVPPIIKMHPVQSSQIAELGHDPATNTLAIRFKDGDGLGALYHYPNTPAADYLKLRSAKSIAKHFHQHIKPRGNHVKIPEPALSKKRA